MTCHDVYSEKTNYSSLKIQRSKAKMVDCCFVVATWCLDARLFKMVTSGINRPQVGINCICDSEISNCTLVRKCQK